MKKLNTLALTLLITGAIDGIRNLPATALFGSTLIFFFAFSAICFLIPAALISAELTASVAQGGIYQWTRAAFGEKTGFFAVWLQWISNIIWMPLSLAFITGTAAYLVDPALAQNKYYLVTTTLALIWVLTIVNLKGVHLSAYLTSFCTIVGLIIPITFIIILLFTWLMLEKPLQIHINVGNIWPNMKNYDNWLALTATMMGLVGIELATVHVKEVNQPQKTLARALALSTIIILFTRIAGSLAIALVIPLSQIQLVNGTIETFAYFFHAFQLSWLTPILTLLIVIGCIGGMTNWVVSPAKGLAQHEFLMPFLRKQNKEGVPHNLLIGQAILVSFICLAFLYLPSINSSYWFLSALCMQLYMLMYVFLFLCALRLTLKEKHGQANYFIPGKKIGICLMAVLGLIGCIVTLAVGFIPPTHIKIGDPFYYELLFCAGMITMIMPVGFFYLYQARSAIQRRNSAESMAQA